MLFRIESEEQSGTGRYVYAFMDDGSVYRDYDIPSMSEGFPSTDEAVNEKWIRENWELVRHHKNPSCDGVNDCV